jgi:hypothetical protein
VFQLGWVLHAAYGYSGRVRLRFDGSAPWIAKDPPGHIGGWCDLTGRLQLSLEIAAPPGALAGAAEGSRTGADDSSYRWR